MIAQVQGGVPLLKPSDTACTSTNRFDIDAVMDSSYANCQRKPDSRGMVSMWSDDTVNTSIRIGK